MFQLTAQPPKNLVPHASSAYVAAPCIQMKPQGSLLLPPLQMQVLLLAVQTMAHDCQVRKPDLLLQTGGGCVQGIEESHQDFGMPP